MSKLTEADVRAMADAMLQIRSHDDSGAMRTWRDRLRDAADRAGLYPEPEPEPEPAPVVWREMCGRCRWWESRLTNSQGSYVQAWPCARHKDWHHAWDWCSRYEARP